jgi:hypothetical protein
MDGHDVVKDLMAKLMAAVEATLQGSTSVRDALAELGRQGYGARLFFVANAEPPDDDADGDDADSDSEGEERPSLLGEPVLRDVTVGPDEPELRFDLTKRDRDFLKSLHIRPDGG